MTSSCNSINCGSCCWLGRTAEHHCTIPDGGLANESIPFDEMTGGLQKCAMYAENSTNVTTSCDHGWTYNNVDGDYTIVNEVITCLIMWPRDRFLTASNDLNHKFQNAPVPYRTMHHSEQKCTHFCCEWCIVGYETGTLWDIWDSSIMYKVYLIQCAYGFNLLSLCDFSAGHLQALVTHQLHSSHCLLVVFCCLDSCVTKVCCWQAETWNIVSNFVPKLANFLSSIRAYVLDIWGRYIFFVLFISKYIFNYYQSFWEIC